MVAADRDEQGLVARVHATTGAGCHPAAIVARGLAVVAVVLTLWLFSTVVVEGLLALALVDVEGSAAVSEVLKLELKLVPIFLLFLSHRLLVMPHLLLFVLL